jgi:hypothetical protein
MEKGYRSVVESGTQCQRQLGPEPSPPRPSVPIAEDYNTESDVKPTPQKKFFWLAPPFVTVQIELTFFLLAIVACSSSTFPLVILI